MDYLIYLANKKIVLFRNLFFNTSLLYRMNVGQFVQSGRGKNKRSWNKSEEECLINGLLEMSADPSWKADGSFKGGFKNKLEEKLNEKFPGCGLKAIPHIESKIKWFKDKYNVLTEMFRTSGFSWDNEKNMIVCERQSYEEFCKVHKYFDLFTIC